MLIEAIPASDVDLFSDEVLDDPYPHYRAIRNLGPAVWMKTSGMFALARYDDVREALRNWEVFSSAQGVAMNGGRAERGAPPDTLNSDPPLHDQLRKVLARPLSLPEMRVLQSRIEAEAEALVERLVARRSFDAATDLAYYLPLNIISFLVGLPEDGRSQMLEWGEAAFNSFGPMNERGRDGHAKNKERTAFAAAYMKRSRLRPDGWAARAFQAADDGDITHDQAWALMMDYVIPSLDTTIHATTSAIYLFAQHHDQWAALCVEPGVIQNAINEILRLESPVQTFSRVVTRDHRVGDVLMPAGSRVMMMYGSANRDERKWTNADQFDIRRAASEHLAFGHGVHQCVGLPLARLEIRALLGALTKRVKRFEITGMERGRNNTLRGIRKLDVTVS